MIFSASIRCIYALQKSKSNSTATGRRGESPHGRSGHLFLPFAGVGQQCSMPKASKRGAVA